MMREAVIASTLRAPETARAPVGPLGFYRRGPAASRVVHLNNLICGARRGRAQMARPG
jgi:hypothetical protein